MQKLKKLKSQVLKCTNKTVLFIIYVIVYATWCFIRGKEKSPFVLLFDPGGFLIITHLFLLPFCQFPNFEHFESKHNEKREKFNGYVCQEYALESKIRLLTTLANSLMVSGQLSYLVTLVGFWFGKQGGSILE